MSANNEPRFSIWLTMRLSSFQIGSAMGDVLTAGVWNRIMIADFGLPAWPVGLLIALRYLLSPLSIWAGHRSDTSPLWGRYRSSYIWLGRGLMVASFPLLGAATSVLEQNTGSTFGWLLAVACFVLYGLGTLLSGSPFLALVRDSAPREKQGVAIAFVETVLISMFPVAAIGFGRLLSDYSLPLFWELIGIVAAISAFFWVFGTVRVERRGYRPVSVEVSPRPARETLGEIWRDPRTRRFFVFLAVATFSAWMQDNILEPFGAEVFDFPLNVTTRLTGYWGTATVLTLLSSFALWRRRPPEANGRVTRVGLGIMSLGMLLLALSPLIASERLFYLALVVFGGGFGFYSFGGLSLMAAMSPDPHAGAYLGLWTIAILVSKGLGTAMGGVFRDLLLLGLSESLTYAIVFFISATGLLAAIGVLTALDVPAFVRERGASAEARDLALAGLDM
jgi:BCD family chlorophyll transporter-like MFS transporter